MRAYTTRLPRVALVTLAAAAVLLTLAAPAAAQMPIDIDFKTLEPGVWAVANLEVELDGEPVEVGQVYLREVDGQEETAWAMHPGIALDALPTGDGALTVEVIGVGAPPADAKRVKATDGVELAAPATQGPCHLLVDDAGAVAATIQWTAAADGTLDGAKLVHLDGGAAPAALLAEGATLPKAEAFPLLADDKVLSPTTVP